MPKPALQLATPRPETPAQRGTRMGQALTRKHVLGTVYELISEHGIENFSMRQVAQAAGLSTGTINYHFGSKQRLLIDALESAYELPDDWEQYSGSAAVQLRRLVLGYVFRSSKDRFWRFWINYLAMSTRNDELLSHQQDRYERQARFWAKLIGDAVAAGECRPGLDARREAEELLNLAHGLLVRQLLSPSIQVRAEARKLLAAALDALAKTPTAR